MSQSPFLSDVPLDEALHVWAAARSAAGCQRRLASESVPITKAGGRVTAAAVWARRSSPAYDAAAMDGIAVRAAATAAARPTSPLALEADTFQVVDTGDVMPAGSDAVIMLEHVELGADGRATIFAAVPPNQHVRSIGEDVAAGELLLPPGQRLRGVDLAAAAAAGVLEVEVVRRPRVVIVPTGDEIRPLGADLSEGDIPDTNSLLLAEQARDAGADATVSAIQPDDVEVLVAAARAASARADVVLLLAGSSAGRDDHTATVVAEAGRVTVHGVAVKPGHPVILGILQPPAGAAVPVVGVPGYPVSAALTFEIFVAPLLAQLGGLPAPARPVIRARLARKLPSTIGAEDWIRVRLGQVGDGLVASPLSRGAGVLTSLVRADGLLRIPAAEEGVHAGAAVDVELLQDERLVRQTTVAIGSHDMALDVLAAHLAGRQGPEAGGRRLVSTHAGSLGGLMALRDGLCHLAGCHLLDTKSGTYTLPFIDRVLGDDDVAVVRLGHREQGLIVPAGNPLELRTLDDVIDRRARFVNRQRGAGTRVLLDHLLDRAGIEADAVTGYGRQEHTHLAVAAAVAGGRADCGLGVHAAAASFGLEFIPIATEPFDLVMRRASLEDERVTEVLAVLTDPDFVAEVEGLGGYDLSAAGQLIR